MSSNSCYLSLYNMEFVGSDGILKRRLNALTDHSRSVDVVHKWLKSDEGTAFIDSIIQPGDEIQISIRRREPPAAVDYVDTPWAKMFNDSRVKDPTSKLGKQFRLRFRVPFQLFELLVDYCKQFNIF